MPDQPLTPLGPALEYLKSGGTIARLAWVGDFLAVHDGDDAEGTLDMRYIFITSPAGDRQPWTPTHADLLANDWISL